jgi:hypothetical protein
VNGELTLIFWFLKGNPEGIEAALVVEVSIIFTGAVLILSSLLTESAVFCFILFSISSSYSISPLTILAASGLPSIIN